MGGESLRLQALQTKKAKFCVLRHFLKKLLPNISVCPFYALFLSIPIKNGSLFWSPPERAGGVSSESLTK